MTDRPVSAHAAIGALVVVMDSELRSETQARPKA
jgi:hypothetical protein